MRANLAALEVKAIGGRVYNIACGARLTLNELAESLRREIGCDVEPVHGPDRAGDVRHSMADISRAQAELGYEPVVGLEEGVRLTVDHYVTVDDSTHHPRVMRSIQQAPSLPAVLATRPIQPPRRGRRFLITGGAGFIGSHLVEALVEHDKAERIVILDDLSTGQLTNIEPYLCADRVSFVHGSVGDAELVDELMGNADICVHLASAVGVQMIVNEPLDTLMRSVRGSNVVMHAASRHGVRVLFSSTSEVYGKQTTRERSPSRTTWSSAHRPGGAGPTRSPRASARR